jgi:hypothetical protein
MLRAFRHPGQGERETLAVRDDLQAGIRVKMRRAAFGLRAADFLLILLGLPVIGQIGQVHGHFHAAFLPAAAQLGRDLGLQGLIEPLFE